MSSGKWYKTRFLTADAKEIAQNMPGITVFQLATELQKVKPVSRRTAIKIAYRVRANYPQLVKGEKDV